MISTRGPGDCPASVPSRLPSPSVRSSVEQPLPFAAEDVAHRTFEAGRAVGVGQLRKQADHTVLLSGGRDRGRGPERHRGDSHGSGQQ